jgi:hypothetical protein
MENSFFAFFVKSFYNTRMNKEKQPKPEGNPSNKFLHELGEKTIKISIAAGIAALVLLAL